MALTMLFFLVRVWMFQLITVSEDFETSVSELSTHGRSVEKDTERGGGMVGTRVVERLWCITLLIL